ncbi:inovirus Gp2 family protein [Vibrio harveyi]|uniref:inovirus Gp2 family protein n=1 Tax=Vibrio harveyi TaxID=669 RepID=UPI00215C390B|nr:inovirus Gp2 family protein [Vibrio harveyi]MCR9772579.1 inovirus Gp2 family protein [Vibrio harveyi]
MSNKHVILHKRLFRGYSLSACREGLYKDLLVSMSDILDYALKKHDKALAMRIDLFLPKDFDDDSRAVISDFFRILRSKIQKDVKPDSGRDASVPYVWRKQSDKAPSINYRIMLFLDYNLYFGVPMDIETRKALEDHLRSAWSEAIENHYQGKEHYFAVFEDRGHEGLGTLCQETSLPSKSLVFKKMSYLAEVWDEDSYCFGTFLD